MNDSTPGRPHELFCMIREFHFADGLTLADAICGTGAPSGNHASLLNWNPLP